MKSIPSAAGAAFLGLLGAVSAPSGLGAADEKVAAVLQRVAAHEFHPVRDGFTRDRDLGKAGIASPDDPDWRVRTLAVRDLVRLGHGASRDLATALGHEDVHVRQIAATVLGILGREEVAAEALEKALAGDGDSLVRTQAAVALRQIGSLGSLEALRRALDDPDGDVRHQAELAMHSLRQGYAVEPELAAAYAALDEADFSRAEVGENAPDFELDASAGGRWRLSDLHGDRKALIVWIFADW